MENGLLQLKKLGQSIWYDNISRNLLQSGALKKLADEGILGVTSNPTIFEKAISSSNDYDNSLKRLSQNKLSPEDIIEELMIEDIKNACDIFEQTYIKTTHLDGYVSIEVDPTLANDTQGTISAAKKLWDKISRKNLMIKIPATIEGLNAIEEVIGLGINVNVTLIFSIERYFNVANQYVKGLAKAKMNGIDLSTIRSVASVFVSRTDSLVDKLITEKIKSGIKDLDKYFGKAAVANSKLLYQSFKNIFYTDEFNEFQKLGANIQRPLWASTGTKNPNYSQTLYIDTLVGNDTVNTVPPATLELIKNKNYDRVQVEDELKEYEKVIEVLSLNGIDFNSVFLQLEKEGVESFKNSFFSLKATLEKKIKEI